MLNNAHHTHTYTERSKSHRNVRKKFHYWKENTSMGQCFYWFYRWIRYLEFSDVFFFLTLSSSSSLSTPPPQLLFHLSMSLHRKKETFISLRFVLSHKICCPSHSMLYARLCPVFMLLLMFLLSVGIQPLKHTCFAWKAQDGLSTKNNVFIKKSVWS